MNVNRIGMNVKKNVNDALSTILGVITKSRGEKSKLHGAEPADGALSEREAERVFMEAETLKAQAYKLVQEFQKC